MLLAWLIEHRSTCDKAGIHQGPLLPVKPSCVLLLSDLSGPICLAGPGYNYIISSYPDRASKAAIHAVCISPS